MADLQVYFRQFDRLISLDQFDRSDLRAKKAVLLSNLARSMRSIYGPLIPKFRAFEQGSIVLGTGVKPLEEDDFDIDIGLIFDISKDDYTPITVKNWVYNALDRPPRTVEYRRSCIRVQYQRQEENVFHVDLAIYSNPDREPFGESKYHIAKGNQGSQPHHKLWEESSPFLLRDRLKKRFSDTTDRQQFCRVIKYLKRWKDYNFYSESAEKPTGIALTACAYKWFRPYKEKRYGRLGGLVVAYDDLRATASLIKAILQGFNSADRLEIHLPVEPFNDLFHKMTIKQMQNLRTELLSLHDALVSALLDSDKQDACYTLQNVFGEEFHSVNSDY